MLERKDIISDEAIQAPLVLAENFTKLLGVTQQLIKTLEDAGAGAQLATNLKTVNQETAILTDQEKQVIAIQKQLTNAIAKNNDEYADYKRLTNEVNTATKERIALGGKDSLTINKTNSSIKELGAALNKNREAYAKLTTQEQRNTAEGKKLLSVIVQQDSEFKDLRKSMGQHQDEVGNYALATTNLKEEMRAARGEMVAIADTLGVGSQQYQEAAKRMGEIADKISDAKDEAKAFQGDTALENLGTRFGMLEDKIGNLDFKGAGEQIKGITALSRQMTFKETISGVGGLGKSFVQLGKAILTNPLFLLAAIVIGVGVAVYKLKDSIAPLRMIFDAVGSSIEFVTDQLKTFSDWLGISSFKSDEAAQKEISNLSKREKATADFYDFAVALADASGKRSIFIERKKFEELLKIAEASLKQQLSLGAKADKELLKQTKENLAKYKQEIALIDAAIETDKANKRKENTKKEKDALFELQKFRIEQAIIAQERIVADEEKSFVKRNEAALKAEQLRFQLASLIQKSELAEKDLNENEKTLIEEKGNAKRLDAHIKFIEEKKVLSDAEIEDNALMLDKIANDTTEHYGNRVAAAEAAGALRLQSEQQIADKIKAINKQILDDLKADQKEENDIVATGLANELAAMDQAFGAGDGRRAKYQRDVMATEEEFANAMLQQQLAHLVEQRATMEGQGESLIEIDRAIAEARGAIAAKSADERLEYEKRLNEELINLANQTVQTASAFYLADSEAKIQNLEIKLEKEQEAAERSLAIVGNDAQAKTFIQEQLKLKQDEINRQIAAERRKQFIFNRRIEAAEIIANTASGIVKSVSASPLTFGLPWSAFMAATGALQLARLFATPIPQFATGVENFEGGAAIVGERGMELVREGNQLSLTPSKATLTSLKKGADVIPHDETMKILAASGLVGAVSGGSQYDFQRIEGKLDEVGGRIERAVSKGSQDVYDEHGYRRYERNENGRVRRLDKRYKLG